MTDFKAKMHQIRFRLGLRPRPCWGSLQRSPRPSSWIWGLLLRRGKGKGGEEGKGGEGRGGKGKGGERLFSRAAREGAEQGRVWGGGIPLPSRLGGSGGALLAPPARSGAEPRPQTHFWYIIGSQKASDG